MYMYCMSHRLPREQLPFGIIMYRESCTFQQLYLQLADAITSMSQSRTILVMSCSWQLATEQSTGRLMNSIPTDRCCSFSVAQSMHAPLDRRFSFVATPTRLAFCNNAYCVITNDWSMSLTDCTNVYNTRFTIQRHPHRNMIRANHRLQAH